MSPTVVWLGPAWATLVGALLWSRRPRRALRVAAAPLAMRAGPITRLGARARAVVGVAPDPVASRPLGVALLAALALLPVVPALAPIPLLLGIGLPRLSRIRRDHRATQAARSSVPDAIDLLALALGAGVSLPAALALVAPRVPAPIGPALAAAEVRARHGQPLVEALEEVAAALPATAPMLALLAAAHQDGTPVVEPLARLAEEQRLARRREAEAAARQVPVRLLFPLVLCTLPAFALLTVVPPVVLALGDLRH
ncbi:MAG: type II secretion system F family protein [Iamia sp.]